MAYYRKRRNYRRYKKRTKKATAWYNKKYSPLEAGQAALKGVAYLRGLVNSEMKHLETTGLISGLITQAGTVQPLVLLSQGDTIATRNGNSVLLKNIYLKGQISFDTGATTGSVVRFWLIEDTQTVSDTTPTFATIFNNRNILSAINYENAGRFKILQTKEFSFDYARPIITFNLFKKFYIHHVRFNGTASTDYQKGQLYFVMTTSAAANQPSLILDARVSYHDN